MTGRGTRHVLAVCACTVAVLLGTSPGTAAAQGAAHTAQGAAHTTGPGSYRYWAFWEGEQSGGAWSYATKGPSVLRPEDGAVLGFRFALSEDSKDASKPRGDASFDAACARTEAQKDRKRIAISIDFGTAADASGGDTPPKARTACAQVAEDASAAEALADVAKPLRYNSDALLCAIDGYPDRGCGEQVSGSGKSGSDKGDGPSKDAPSGEDGADQGDGGLGPVTGIAAAVAAFAVLAFAAVRQTRRRR